MQCLEKRNKPVSLDVIDRICSFLKRKPMDILTYIPVTSEDEVKRGDIWWADLSAIISEEKAGLRPVLILKINEDTVVAAPATTRVRKHIKTHILLDPETSGLPRNSTIMLEHLRVLDKSRLTQKVGEVDESTINKSSKSFFSFLYGF